MAGIINSALSGALEGAGRAGVAALAAAQQQYGAEELLKLRTESEQAFQTNLLKFREEAEIRGEVRKRTQAAAVGTEAETARTGMVDDLSGTFRPRTSLEGAEAEAGVYRKHGLIEAAQRTQENERSRQERAETRLDARTDRNADNQRADKQLDIAMQNARRLKDLTNAQIEHFKGGKTPLPNIKVETIDQDGVKRIVNVDQNSGAIGVVNPGEAAKPGESNWFSPDKPATPERQPTVTWSLNGRVLPGGLSDLYPAMKARIGEQGGAGGIVDPFASRPSEEHLTALRARKNDPAAIAAFEKQYGSGAATKYLPEPPQGAIDALRKDPKLAGSFEDYYGLPKGGAAKYLPAQAQKRPPIKQFFGPDVGTVSEGYRFSGGDPNERANWERATGPGAALDEARVARKQALDKLQSYGQVQRKRDPDGFTAAQEILRKAEAAVAEATQAWERSVGGNVGAARFVAQP